MQILARAVGRRKEAVAQVQIIEGTGQFIINDRKAQDYLQNNSCSMISIKSPFNLIFKAEENLNSLRNQPLTEVVAVSGFGDQLQKKETLKSSFSLENIDTRVKVKGGGLIGQAEAIKLAVARALCEIKNVNIENVLVKNDDLRKQLKTKGYLTQDSRVKERRKYGLKKARKAPQYHKR